MKQMTGYFGGYISKKQKMGRFELKKSIGALPLLEEKLKGRNLSSSSAQLAHVTNRCFTVLESKGILRTATEEFLLSSRFKPHDELAAEFIRTFRHTFFHGLYFVKRYEALKTGEERVTVNIPVPRGGGRKVVADHVALYGFRSSHPDLFFLSPWVFVQWFKPHALRPPGKNYELTKWISGRGPSSQHKKEELSEYVLGEDYDRNEQYIESRPDIYLYPEDAQESDSIKQKSQYVKFQQVWVLVKRTRPVVPCPEVTPLPSRKKSKEVRAKLSSIYMRPWTFFSSYATSEVPLLTDLDLTKEQWLSEYAEENRSLRKKRKSSKMVDGKSEESKETRNIRHAWKDYLTRVPETAARQIKNFLLATLAEGRNDQQDEEAGAGTKLESVTCHLEACDIDQILSRRTARLTQKTTVTQEDASPSFQRLDKATSVAAALIETQSAAHETNMEKSKTARQKAFRHEREFVAKIAEADELAPLDETESKGCASFTKNNWLEAYHTWRSALEKSKKAPYWQQWLILETVHDRCVREFIEMHQIPDEMTACYLCTCLSTTPDARIGKSNMQLHVIPAQDTPVLKFVHGLPGSGKTAVLKWLRSYFEEVWDLCLGHHFIFLAPLNSMAANIEGATIHSWGEIGFTDRRGQYISTKSKKEDEVSTVAGLLDFPRWILIDEIEACGAELQSMLDITVTIKAPKVSPYKLKNGIYRAYGGVNVLKFGDFWQLPPTGSIAIMQDPRRASESAGATSILNMYWGHANDEADMMQEWTAESGRVLHLAENKRSGGDAWPLKLKRLI